MAAAQPKKVRYPNADPVAAWWQPPADKLEAAGFRCEATSTQGSSWSWYSTPGQAGGYHVGLHLHGNGWIFIYNTRYRPYPKLQTVPDGAAFTQLLELHGWRRADGWHRIPAQ